MNPDSENIPKTNPTSPGFQGDIPQPSAAPGGVVRPAGSTEEGIAAPVAPTVPQQQPETPIETSQNPVSSFQPSAPAQPNISQGLPPEGGVNSGSSSGMGSGGRQIFPEDTPGSSPTGKGVLNKKLLLVVLPLLLVVLIAGFVFGYYIPNKPENVYKTGLKRTGDALQILVDKGATRETYDKYNKSEITAAVDINSNGQNIKGDFTAKFDETKLDTDFNLSLPAELTGSEQLDMGLSVLSEQAEGKEFPDSYVSIRGLEAFGADLFMPGISKYDDRWISISSEYWASIAKEAGFSAEDLESPEDYPTFEEVSSVIKDVYSVTNEYVFTSDPQKAVLVNKQYIGKEDIDGVSAYHYEVGIDKEKSIKYCEAVTNVAVSSAVYKKLSGKNDEQIEQDKQNIPKDCEDGHKDLKEDEDTFDMWVDSKYKLIKRLRFYDDRNNKEEYFEVGQNYDGGDAIGLFMGTKSATDGFNSRITFTTNLASGESSGEMTFDGGSDTGKYDGKITLTAKPLAGDLQINKPDNAVDIGKVLKDFGLDSEELWSSGI